MSIFAPSRSWASAPVIRRGRDKAHGFHQQMTFAPFDLLAGAIADLRTGVGVLDGFTVEDGCARGRSTAGLAASLLLEVVIDDGGVGA
jgi:hypothetical protein